MGRLTERPYAGTWGPNLRKVIKHTPDALVYINGDTYFPGCGGCGGRIDIQKFITGVSCDPTTEGIASATISMAIPKYESQGLFADGKFALRPGLEVHVYIRGYFPAQNLLTGDDSARATDPSLNEGSTIMYPYYLVFHGVVTSSSHNYSGGEYTATLSCADLLHFWQYQRVVEQGASLVRAPVGSKINSSLLGHNFSGMTPYSVIYTLYRDVMGAAGGVESVFIPELNATNVSPVSDAAGESYWTLSMLYWQKRFSQNVTTLRMFGANGTLYNAFQAAYLSTLTTEQTETLAVRYAEAQAQGTATDPMAGWELGARATGFDAFSVFATGGQGTETTNGLGVNAAALQAYIFDLGRIGINLMETVYLTKTEVAQAVCRETGFEFFQDVDGDIVFKPPFYNMDTSGLRVYRIEPEDVISFDTQEKEPDCTVVKWTGSFMTNTAVPSLTGEYGSRAEFIDYRAVAQFGWRQETFDTAYYSGNPAAAFFACIARYDYYNIGVKSASVTVPLRPELRPGYPVYIAHVDCFYYIKGLSHSLQFGGQGTTTLTLVGRRAKFHAPGVSPKDGSRPTVNDIHMDDMHLPRLPLTLPVGSVGGRAVPYATGLPGSVYYETTTETGTETVAVPRAYNVQGGPGINSEHKTQGFPNVVMAIDPELVNPSQFARGFELEALQTEAAIKALIRTVLMGPRKILQRADDGEGSEKALSLEGPWKIQVSNDEWQVLPSVGQLVAAAQRLTTQSRTRTTPLTSSTPTPAEVVYGPTLEGIQQQEERLFGVLVSAARDVHEKAMPGSSATAKALELVSDFKSIYSYGKTLPGYYRYYSSAHPDPKNQGMLALDVTPDGTPTTGPLFTLRAKATQFAKDGSGFVTGDVTAGLPIATKGRTFVVKPTHEIRSFDTALLQVRAASRQRVILRNRPVESINAESLTTAFTKYFAGVMSDLNFGPSTSLAEMESEFVYQRLRVSNAIRSIAGETTAKVSSPSANTKGMVSINVLEGAETTNSGFNPSRRHPVTGVVRPHNGADLDAPVGTGVLAANDGIISRISYDADGFGHYVEIEHEDGWFTLYGHLSENSVTKAKGAAVVIGEKFALSGQSGLVSGPHLHFELYQVIDGKKSTYNPADYIAMGGSFEYAPSGASLEDEIAALDAEIDAAVADSEIVDSELGAEIEAAIPGTTTPNNYDSYANAVLAAVFPSYGKGVLSGVPGDTNEAKVENFAKEMATAIVTPAIAGLQEIMAQDTTDTLHDACVRAWLDMFPGDGNYDVAPLVRDTKSAVVNPNDSIDYYTPVFPVSDERGYEVVGTFPYGRGLNLTSNQMSVLQGPSATAANYDEADAFVKAVVALQTGTDTASLALALGELSPEGKAEIAASMDPALLADDNISKALGIKDIPSPGTTGPGSNTPASTLQGINVFPPTNAAYGLADMRVAGMDTCQCFEGQPDVLLLRGVGENSTIFVEGTEADFAAYARETAEAQISGWSTLQNAYRGTVGSPVTVKPTEG
jgi:murein DD-endopeptidase MepM/ murein hydrolase activator NlpD